MLLKRNREREKKNQIAASFNTRKMSSLKRRKQLNREYCLFYSEAFRHFTLFEMHQHSYTQN